MTIQTNKVSVSVSFYVLLCLSLFFKSGSLWESISISFLYACFSLCVFLIYSYFELPIHIMRWNIQTEPISMSCCLLSVSFLFTSASLLLSYYISQSLFQYLCLSFSLSAILDCSSMVVMYQHARYYLAKSCLMFRCFCLGFSFELLQILFFKLKCLSLSVYVLSPYFYVSLHERLYSSHVSQVTFILHRFRCISFGSSHTFILRLHLGSLKIYSFTLMLARPRTVLLSFAHQDGDSEL